jgi:hypothetical protein
LGDTIRQMSDVRVRRMADGAVTAVRHPSDGAGEATDVRREIG